MPYPNEHSCRLEDPSQFDRFNRVTCGQKHDGKCIDVIYGIKAGKSKVQALRYKTSIWDAGDARAHCKSRGGAFEAAAKEEAGFPAEEQSLPSEHKMVMFEVKDVDDDEGTFDGYASIFDKEPDSYRDIVSKGAFKKTIKEQARRIKILWNHSVMEPIGKPIELREDDRGLYVKAKLTLAVQRAKEIFALIKDGVINELSIGYDAIKAEWTGEGEDKIRILKEIKLYDISPVSFAAKPSAVILNAKAAERALDRGDTESIEVALIDLKTLLVKHLGEEEPSEDTPPATPAEDDPEAAEIEEARASLDTIGAEIDGFDLAKANAQIDAAIEIINRK